MAKKSAINDLEAKLASRADKNVQEKIAKFKSAIIKALTDLFGEQPQGQQGNLRFGHLAWYGENTTDGYAFLRAHCHVLELAISETSEDNTKIPWPGILWRMEENRLRDELLAKMDLMQQLINAPPRDTTNDVPREESEA